MSKVGVLIILFVILVGVVSAVSYYVQDYNNYLTRSVANNIYCTLENGCGSSLVNDTPFYISGSNIGLQDCPNTQGYFYNSTYGGWQCQSKSSTGGGTVTSVDAANPYLDGGPITTSGTITFNESRLNITVREAIELWDGVNDTDTFNTTEEILRAANNPEAINITWLRENVTRINVNGTLGVVVGFTSGTYDGDLSYDTYTGYEAGNARCNADFPGSHFCLEVEVMNSNIIDGTNHGVQAWVVKGAPGYTANANDCEGWTKTTDEIGPFWDYTENSGVGAGKLTPCTSTLKLACCR